MTVEEWLGKDNTLGKDIIEKKYLYKGETLDHWFDRISNGDQELRNLIVEKKFMPGGRILAHRGIPQDEMRSTYSNCFSGETKIVTSEGLKELKDLVGKDIKVLANLNWRDATVKSFGVQELRRLTLRKDRSEEEMVFYVTGDHLWYVVKNLIKSLKPTDSLEVDDVIPSETFGEIWKVVSLEKTDRVEEVFCAVVPETECFALEGNVLTHNCYVLGTDDSLEEIYKTCANMARTYSLGGGVGVDISKLRPRGAIVHNSAKETTGAVSFMKTFDVVTETIGQNGRRGALMLSIDIRHPDIEEFVDIKRNTDQITHANISVRVNDKFMKAVEEDQDYLLHWPCEMSISDKEIDAVPEYGKLVHIETECGPVYLKKVKAKNLFMRLAENNWDYAEPGILYWDRISNWNMMANDPEFEYAGVNPCAS